MVLAILIIGGASDARAAGIFYQGEYDLRSFANAYDAKVTAFISDSNANVLLNDNEFTLTLQYVSASLESGGCDNGAVLTGFRWELGNGMALAVGPPQTDGVITGPHSNLVSTGKDGVPRGTILSGPGPANVSQYWGYVSNAVGAAGGGVFGKKTTISDIDGKMGGVDYGLVPVGAIALGNGGLGSGDRVLIEADGTKDGSNVTIPTSIIFTFEVTSGHTVAEVIGSISNAQFLFGSDLHARPGGTPVIIPDAEVVPEPGSIAALLSLVTFGAGACVVRRRRAKNLAA